MEYERYGSYYYGTSKIELERDDFIILDLEVNGATKLLTSNDSYIGIFIDIDDNVLIERLNERGHDDQFIEERMNLAKEQRQSMGNFDYIIKNIDLKATIKEILDIYAGDVPQDYTHYTDSDDSKSDSDDNQV